MHKSHHLIPALAIAAIATALLFPTSAQAEGNERLLNANQLRECAQMVRKLRERAPALHNRNQQLDKRRHELAEERARLNNNRGDTDMQAWGRYNERAAAFNNDMVAFRSKVAEVNAIKHAYDKNCANRPFRNSDFQALPKALRKAMKAGLSDVRVPYLADPREK